jgi:hypothetical protein
VIFVAKDNVDGMPLDYMPEKYSNKKNLLVRNTIQVP